MFRKAVAGIPVWVFAIWVMYSAALGLLYVNIPASPDLQIFDYIGWVAASGGTLYVDAAEHNWPGAMWWHMLATSMFGVHSWSFRALDYGVMLSAALSISYMMLRQELLLSARIVVPLYQMMYVTLDVWTSAQRDIFAAHILVITSLCYFMRFKGLGRHWVVLTGFGIFAAVATRPTYLIFGPILLAVDCILMQQTRRSLSKIAGDMAVATAAFCGIALSVVGMSFASGSIHHWLGAAVLFNIEAYSQPESLWTVAKRLSAITNSWHWYIGYATVGAIIWFRKGERQLFALLSALLLTGLISALAQRKGFGYHLGALLPVMASLSAYVIAVTLQKSLERGTFASVTIFLTVAAVALVGLGSKASHALGPQARYLVGASTLQDMLSRYGADFVEAYHARLWVHENTRPDDTVLVWGRHVSINYLAQRRAPTRFITYGMLIFAAPPFRYAENWIAEFEDALLGSKAPAVIIAPAVGSARFFHDLSQPNGSAAAALLKNVLSERYMKAKTFGAIDAYVLVN